MTATLQQSLDFAPDVCAKKHKQNPLSTQAHKSLADAKKALLKQILNFIVSRGTYGATCEEIECLLGISHQTASARCAELKALGLIRVAGQRKTKSGRNAGVLVGA